MADKKKMSVAEILAAARKADSKGDAAKSEAEPPVEEEVVSSEAQAEEQPAEESAPAKAAPAKKPGAGGRPSTAEILAMARANKAKADAPKEDKPKPAAKPAAKAPAAKESPKKGTAGAVNGGAKDTASILAAARKPHKPGPVSKAEAATKAAPAAAKETKAKEKPTAPPMPPKPDYAKPKVKAAAAPEDRRGFLGLVLGSFLGLGFTSLSTTVGLWGLMGARYMFPNILTEPPSKFKVGFPSDFPPGFVADQFKAQYGVWVANAEYEGQQQIYALRAVCTHLGCTPNWLEGEQKFKCPCHGSGFYKDGINFEGPAPRPLERYAIRIADDGQLEIDRSRIFQEEMGQWKDPACFVPV